MFRQHVKRTVVFGVIGLVLSLGIALMLPKYYEGRLEILLGQQAVTAPGMLTEDVMRILERGQLTTAQTERQVLASQAVFLAALEDAARLHPNENLQAQFLDLYRRFDVEVARQPGQQITNSGVAAVLVRAKDPQIAADIANSVAEMYSQERVANQRTAVADAVRYLENMIGTAEEELATAENELRAYKQQNEVSDLQLQTSTKNQELLNLRISKEEVEGQLEGTRAEIRQLDSQLRSLPVNTEASSMVQRNPVLSQLELELAGLEQQRAELVTRYLPDHQDVRNMDERIQETKNRIDAEKGREFVNSSETRAPSPVRLNIEQALLTARARERSLSATLNGLNATITNKEAELQNYPALEGELARLQRERDIFEEKYRRLKSQYEELNNRTETAGRAALVLRQAFPNDRVVEPEPMKFAFIGLIASLCLGLIYSYTVESMRTRVYSADEFGELTGLPVSATLRSLPVGGSAKGIQALAGGQAQPLEAFRYMALAMLSKDFEPPRTVMFTGLQSSSDSSSAAVHYAISLARAGATVALVDADIERPRVSRSFSLEGQAGLTNLLDPNSDATAVKAALVAGKQEGLFVVPVGTAGIKNLTDVPQVRVEAVIKAIRELVQVVIVVVPPCDVLADASSVAPHTDETFLLVSASKNNYRTVRPAYEVLMNTGTRNIHVVLTDTKDFEEPFSGPTRTVVRYD